MSATWEIREGDAFERLAGMPDESVQCCVTSPPYFGLRDYGTGGWEGGEEGCDHRDTAFNAIPQNRDGRQTPGGRGGSFPTTERQFKAECGKCSARRVDRQIGLEATPDEFVARLVGVFGEVRRVLRSDGTLWLNIGDSYASPTKGDTRTADALAAKSGLKRNVREEARIATIIRNKQYRATERRSVGMGEAKAKDLLGIPWLLAFALRADGWYLRSDIIWAKPNPMPESVTDRPTSAHEHVFLLSKSPRYAYDAAAVAEPAADATLNDHRFGAEPDRRYNGAAEKFGEGTSASRRNAASYFGTGASGGVRNRRNVWEIATQPYPDAHFATFPPKLVEPCILAGSAPGDTILDPFAGAGTTGVVALRHVRSFVGIELSPAYAEMARERIRRDGPLLNIPAEVA